MKFLAIDIGTGTQDILVFDSRLNIENGFKIVVPSPTMIVHQKLLNAMKQRKNVLLTGYTMGGGPSRWAAEAHIRSGLKIFATPDAALSFDDNLQVIEEIGIKVIGEEETKNIPANFEMITLRDFDFQAIQTSLTQFGVSLDHLAAIAIAVFDHGVAPGNISDRQFRFEYIKKRIKEVNKLSGFAYRPEHIPDFLTRFKAVTNSAKDLPFPLLVMDTAPAAILGSLLDSSTQKRDRNLIINFGNLHTLGFKLNRKGIEGVFQHHTGEISHNSIDRIIQRFADGALTNREIFEDKGHGAIIIDHTPYLLDQSDAVTVSGPRRSMMSQSKIKHHNAAPFGDMMISGCFGLLSALPDHYPEFSSPINEALYKGAANKSAPWEL